MVFFKKRQEDDKKFFNYDEGYVGGGAESKDKIGKGGGIR